MRRDLRIEASANGDGRTRLTIVRPPHPVVMAVFWVFLATGTVLTLGAAAMETTILCRRTEGTCVAHRVDREVRSLRIADRKARVQVEAPTAPDRAGLSLLFVDARQRSPIAWASWSGEDWLHQAAASVDAFRSDPKRPELELRRRSWPMAWRVGGPFLLLAATLFAFSRRGFRLTLEQLPDAMEVRRQSLLSTAHLPISGAAQAPSLEQETGPDGVRLVLALPHGERFAVTPWIASERELTEVRERLGAFLTLAARAPSSAGRRS